nr:lipocalin family protein [Allomuricauda sp.]
MSYLKNLLFCLLIGLFVSLLSCEGSIEPIGDIENEVNNLDDDDSGNESGNQDDDNTDDTDDDGSGDNDSGNDGSGDDTNDDGNGNNGDDDNPNDTSSILGEWNLVSAEIENGQASTVFNGTDIDFPFSATSKDEDAQVLFSETPDEVNGSGQFTSVISFTLFSQTFTEETIIESPITNGSYETNGSSLTIVDNEGISSEFSINEFSNNTLIVETSFTRSIVLDGLDVDTNGVLILEFTR